MHRGDIGTARIHRRHLTGDVELSAIPKFTQPFTTIKTGLAGRAPKLLIVVEQNREEYIAKAPSKNNSTALECVTEELISSIGRTLPVKIASSRVAMVPAIEGVEDKPHVRFMSRVFIKRGEELLRHGIELVEMCFGLTAGKLIEEIKPNTQAERCQRSI